MRIVLHAGFHKTGTTSLQVTLAAHRTALAGHAHIATLSLTPGLVRATDAARAYSLDHDLASLQAGMRGWAHGLSVPEGLALIISAEDFAGHMPGRFGLVDYRAAIDTIPAAVSALRDRFPAAQVQVLLTTRDARPWLKSLHWQLAMHPEMMLKQRRFCKDFASAADFAAVIAPLTRALAGQAGVTAVPLEALVGRRLGFAEAVYDLAALPDGLRAALPPVGAHNRRSVEGLADQFVALNRARLPKDELERAKIAMRGVMQFLDSDEG
jgi:hypothetical protein